MYTDIHNIKCQYIRPDNIYFLKLLHLYFSIINVCIQNITRSQVRFVMLTLCDGLFSIMPHKHHTIFKITNLFFIYLSFFILYINRNFHFVTPEDSRISRIKKINKQKMKKKNTFRKAKQSLQDVSCCFKFKPLNLKIQREIHAID